MIPLFKVFMSSEANKYVGDVLESGYIGQGSKVEEFEQELKDYFGTKYVLTVNSATSGLTLAFRLSKERYHANLTTSYEGTVAATPLTCTATNWAALSLNLDLNWIDIDPDTCNMSLAELEKNLTHDVVAVSVVHWGGYPIDMERLNFLVDRHNVKFNIGPIIVEDCAHAFGSEYKGQKLGTHGNIAVYSFQAIKHLTTGDGGAIILPNKELYDKAKLLRWYGLDRESSADFRCSQNVSDWGYKFHMNDINASIGLANIKEIGDVIDRHVKNASFYSEALQDIPGITQLENKPDRISSSWIHTILAENRDGLMRKLEEAGIGSSQVHARNDRHDCVAKYSKQLPAMEMVDKKMLCIPCGWWVGDEDREHIAQTIKSGW